MHTNRLALETSPYLRQHAHNPVDWYPWGEEAFQKARAEDKPVFLSIGYSTCHWCHVMERESFEQEAVAEVLNRAFVPIKVDREERPDVDRIYMTFVQATTGGGGWPMSVFLTPRLEPFFGGTYFPPDNRYGRPGFKSLLEHLENAWKTDRARIEESGANVTAQLRHYLDQSKGAGGPLDANVFDSAFQVFRRSFDTVHGGFGQAPKFPRPAALHFLLRYYKRAGNEEALEMTLATLGAMAAGGMKDQIGGGFHRYSVDERWFVPHFEKMLYDQAQLAMSYLEAFQITGEADFADEARGIFEYVLRDMTHSAGGFFSAEDADSVIDPANPGEKGEGAFYIWRQEEIESALGQPAAGIFSMRYGVTSEGNVHEDPHAEFTGRNILYLHKDIPEITRVFGIAPEEVNQVLRDSEAKLLSLRARRVRPHLDDKILAGWNGLMISAFARGAQVLDEPRYAEAASRAAAFLLSRMYNPATGILSRSGNIPGFLDDYFFVAQALLDLYETDSDAARIGQASTLAEKAIELFEDTKQGAFFSTAAGDPNLLLRIKEDYDGAEPSGNAVAVLTLVRLSAFTGRADFLETARKAAAALSAKLASEPSSSPQLLSAVWLSQSPLMQVIVAGDPSGSDTKAMLRSARRRFLPDSVTMLASPELARLIPS
ncbi:MAG TPA: thioredoxin domain-containing protein, partial [Bryobacteraceae bacterium]|nr:thioredoxin domain-containing protein [Bryobacteraceae bacterium]